MPAFTNGDADRIRAAALEVIEKHHLPGVAIGVVHGDDLVFAEAFGHADIESQTPHSIGRRQRIASVTKTMVGLSVMAAVNEGRLSLDDRAVDHLPEIAFDGPGAQITVRHLLTHTSGIGEAPTMERLRETVNPNPDERAEPGDFALLYPEPIAVEAAPGTKWSYANHGYALLGEILCRAEKAPLQDVLARRVFGPLGMTETDVIDEYDERLATGYHRPPSADTTAQLARAGMTPPQEQTVDGHNIRGKFRREFNRGMLAAGAGQSTIPDMARYASALLRRGGGIVAPATFDAMIAPAFCPDPRLINWGLSFARTPRYGRTLIGHGGAFLGGWNTHLDVIPEEGVAIITFLNIMLDSPAPVFNRIIGAVLDVPAQSYPELPVDRTILESASGVYECTPGKLMNFRPSTRVGRIQLTVDSGVLMLRSRWGAWKEGGRLTPAAAAGDPTLFVVQTADAEPALIALTVDASGRVDGLRCDDLVHMVRNDALEPWA